MECYTAIKIKQISDTCYHLNGSQKNYASWTKQDTRVHILYDMWSYYIYDSIYMKCQEKANF